MIELQYAKRTAIRERVASYLARRAATTFGAGMKLDDGARVGVNHGRRPSGIDQLVTVMVHCDATLRADQQGIRGHGIYLISVNRNLFPAITQSSGHPDEFLQKLVNAPYE